MLFLYHCKLDEMKTPHKKKARQEAVYIVCYENQMIHLNVLYQV